MFFATCRYDSKTNAYYPLKSGKAVLYTVDLRALLLDEEGKSSPLPLGLEPLPRPESQKAFAIQMLPGENLNRKPWARSTILKITKCESNRYFEMFEGGQTLFPSNPFDNHLELLRDSRTIPKPIIELAIKLGWVPPHTDGVDAATRELQTVGYKIIEQQVTIDLQTITAAIDDWQRRKVDLLSRIQMRGVGDHLQVG